MGVNVTFIVKSLYINKLSSDGLLFETSLYHHYKAEKRNFLTRKVA